MAFAVELPVVELKVGRTTTLFANAAPAPKASRAVQNIGNFRNNRTSLAGGPKYWWDASVDAMNILARAYAITLRFNPGKSSERVKTNGTQKQRGEPKLPSLRLLGQALFSGPTSRYGCPYGCHDQQVLDRGSGRGSPEPTAGRRDR